MAWLHALHHYLPAPMRLTVIYKSPLPQLQLNNMGADDFSDTEEDPRESVGKVPREVEHGDQDSFERRVSVRGRSKKKLLEGMSRTWSGTSGGDMTSLVGTR